jgi:hypothetical protein
MSIRISFSKKEILVIILCVPIVLSVGFGLIVIPTLLFGGEDTLEIFQQNLRMQSRQSRPVPIETPLKNMETSYEQSTSAIGSGKKFKSSSSLNQVGWILKKAHEVKGVKDVELIGTSSISQLSNNNPPDGCEFWGYTLYQVTVTWKYASDKTKEVICVETNNSPSFGMSPKFTYVFRGR